MKKYRITEEELKILMEACKGFPVIMCGVDLGQSPQERVNNAWKALGKKYGFKWYTARSAETVPCEFIAEAEE